MRQTIASLTKLVLASLAGGGLLTPGAVCGQDPGPVIPKLSLFVVKPDAPKKPLTQKVEIDKTTVDVKQGDTVEGMLKAKGIHLDMEAVDLLYSLNPGLKDLKKLPPKLTIPVASGPDAETIRKSGGFVAVVRDQKLKDDFVREATDAADLAESFSKLDKDRFASREEQVKLTNAVTKAGRTLDVFRMVVKGRTRPLSPDLIRQLEGEAAVLNQILARAAKSTDKIPAADVAKLEGISNNMSLRLKGLDEVMGAADIPPRWPEVQVTVKTIAKGVEKNHLQVYVVPEALYGKPEYAVPFERFSSPTSRALPEAHYMLWAETPGEKPRKEHGRKRVEVIRREGTDTLTIEITVP